MIASLTDSQSDRRGLFLDLPALAASPALLMFLMNSSCGGGDGTGKNMLGKTLMAVRHAIASNEANPKNINQNSTTKEEQQTKINSEITKNDDNSKDEELEGIPKNENRNSPQQEDLTNNTLPIKKPISSKKTKTHHTTTKQNVWLEKDGTSLFEKQSASTVNVTGQEEVVLSSKALTSQARSTAYQHQFQRKFDKIKVEGDPNDEEEEEEEDISKGPSKLRMQLSDFINKKSNNKHVSNMPIKVKSNKKKSNNSNNSKQEQEEVSVEELLTMADSFLKASPDVDKELAALLAEQIKSVISSVQDENQVVRLLQIVEQIEAK